MRAVGVCLLFLVVLAGCSDVVDDAEPGKAIPKPGLDGDRSGDEGSSGGTGGIQGGDARSDADGNVSDAPALGGKRFLHADGDRLWMDASEEGSSQALEGSVAPGGEDTFYRFTLEPKASEDMRLGFRAFVKVHWSNQQSVNGQGMEVRAALLIDDVRHEGYQNDTAAAVEVFLPDEVPAGADVMLEVCVCGGPYSSSGYRIDVDGRSWVDFGS